MRHKVAELEGALLDAAVAKALGLPVHPGPGDFMVATSIDHVWAHEIRPSRDWKDGGPIIERERIELTPHGGADNPWQAECTGWPDEGSDGIWHGIGRTPLIAAMRAYVASKFGEEVDLP